MKGSFQREERSIGKMQRNKVTANTRGMVCYIIYYYFMKVFLVIFFFFYSSTSSNCSPKW